MHLMRWGWLGDRLHRAALLLSVLTIVVCGLGIAALTWWLLWSMLGAKTETPNQMELAKIALSVAAGIGGAVGLVVAYRRQRDLERGRFADLFGAAARQLGDTDVAVRIAGVYAMAGVADEFSAPGHRQQCVDVLCGYIRLPYDHDAGANHLVSRAESSEEFGTKVERVYQFRQNDHEVRRTILEVITARLRRPAEVSWSDCDFDFTGALFVNAYFKNVEFGGRRTTFHRARFVGDRNTTFENARFTGEHVTFRDATFTSRFVDFDRAEFRGDRTTFDGMTVECPHSSFTATRFSGSRTTFLGARLVGTRTSFRGATFRAAFTTFENATFDGEHTSFHSTEFVSPRITFSGAKLYAGTTEFDRARIGAQQRWRATGTRGSDFTRAEFHGTVTFAATFFGGRTVDFSEADFFGDISFATTRFAAGEIRFDNPSAWVGTHFEWDDNPARKPTNIKPDLWPPAPVR